MVSTLDSFRFCLIVAQLFREIVWLFSQSPQHKTFFISGLEWLVMPPVLFQPFRLFYGPDRPIGWARVALVEVSAAALAGCDVKTRRVGADGTAQVDLLANVLVSAHG